MSNYKTPGVYVEEISTLPPSVAQVATAVPAFIGYTGKGPANTPTRISSMVEYETLFGKGQPASYSISGDPTDPNFKLGNPTVNFIMHPCLRLYFLNGGGPCYIVSVGNYSEGGRPAKASLETGIAAIQKVDEPTLLLLPDAVNIAEKNIPSQYYLLCQEILSQCATLQDRFGIFDIPPVASSPPLNPDDTDPKITKFRAMIGANNLSYGAAYTPYLKTGIPYAYDERAVEVQIDSLGSVQIYRSDPDKNGILISCTGQKNPSLEINSNGVFSTSVVNGKLKITGITSGTTAKNIADKWNSNPQNGYTVISLKDNATISEKKPTAIADLNPLNGDSPKILVANLPSSDPNSNSQLQAIYLGAIPTTPATYPQLVVKQGTDTAVEESTSDQQDTLTITLATDGSSISDIKAAYTTYTASTSSSPKFLIRAVSNKDSFATANEDPKIIGSETDHTVNFQSPPAPILVANLPSSDPNSNSQLQAIYLRAIPTTSATFPQLVVKQGTDTAVEESTSDQPGTLTITLATDGSSISDIVAEYTVSSPKFLIRAVGDDSAKITDPTASPNDFNLTGGQYIEIDDASDSSAKGLRIYSEPDSISNPEIEIKDEDSAAVAVEVTDDLDADGNKKLTISVSKEGSKPADIVAAWDQNTGEKGGFNIQMDGDGSSVVKAATSSTSFSSSKVTLDLLKNSNTQLYNAIKAKLDANMMTLPPSSAMAGIYAQVDGTRGVWKAPANVSVNGIMGPAETITAADQEGLNIDATGGKSINVIRNFTGKGTLVWGARTLDGNSNEWRYINVRRLFITIEESVQKACAFAVFEPNDATTWLKVKAMIDNYLYGLWQQGALAGPKPAAAYFVNVGLGKTMTNDDILNGYMIVEIGIAAVRPAEFIVLKFSQKMQEA